MTEQPETRDEAAATDAIEIVLIAAVADNGVIGDGTGLPWSLPSDLKHFKAQTVGKPVVMGRVTWSEIGYPLPDRPNIVVSADPAFHARGAYVVDSLDRAYELARTLAQLLGAREIMVIGGGRLYAAALNDAVRIYLTRVSGCPGGNVFFPSLDPAEWEEIEGPEPVPDPKDSHPYRLVTLQRRSRRL